MTKTAYLTILALTCTLAARADFSYTQTRKSAGGMGAAAAAAAGNQTSKHYLKGQKMKVDSGTTAIIMDFEAQTMTSINHTQKSYTVTKFGDLAQSMKNAGADVKIDVKETGQRKRIGDFNASQVIMTMGVQGMQAGAQGMTMTLETEIWISPDVPGAQELRTFFQKNGDRHPWASMAGAGANAQMQKSMAEMQKKIAAMGGVPVLQVTRMKMGGGVSDAQSAQMQAAMAQAMARMEEMKKQGGDQARAAEAMARVGGARGAMGGGGSLFEVTMESSGFSTRPIADSEFAIPDGYQKR